MQSPVTPNGTVDVPAMLSQQNRRLYRQGRVYQVKVDLDFAAAPQAGYTVYAINNTWMLKKAWQTAFETYREQTLGERNVFNGKLARWSDFRLDLGSLWTGSVGLDSTRIDESGTEQLLQTGEFYNSQVENDSGGVRTFGLVESASRYNILKEFDLTGNMDTEPETPSTQVAYDDLDSDLTDTEISDVTGNGNEPPYAQNDSHWNYPLIKIGEIGSTSEGQKLSTGYFDAPFGFVIIVGTSPHQQAGQSELVITCRAGDYKGVAAHSLME